MRTHRVTSFAALAASALILSACGNGADNGNDDGGNAENGGTETAEQSTLRFAHLGPEHGPYHQTLLEMGEELEERTEGRVTIDIYPDGQLGGELELIEQIESASIDGAALTAGSISSVVPVIGGMELPYLFNDQDHAREAVDGEVGEFIAEEMAAADLVALGFWEMGYKQLTNSVRPIQSAEDAAGVSIRVLENPILIDTYSALGMDPTPLPWPETYTSLQQGVVEGFEGPYESFLNGALYEVQDYSSEVGMIYGGVVLTLSQESLDSLSEEDQQILLEIGEEYAQVQRTKSEEFLADAKEEIIDNGVEVIEAEDLDVDSFREAVEPVRDGADEYADLVELADATR